MNSQTKEFLGRNAILNSALIGFEFEFYSKLSFFKASRSLEKVLGKKIITAYKVDQKGKSIKGAHTDIPVSYDTYKLEHDFSGGANMMELVTGPTPFFESKIILAKVLNWIKSNGRTGHRSGIHVNISFDKLKTPENNIDTQNLDPLKLILNYDEDRVFAEFPNRKDNVFAKSIDFIFPVNMFTFSDNIKNINKSSFSVPNEKYFGFNFSKLQKGYIEMRYMGGKDYEDKIDKILNLIDYTILCIYECLRLPVFNDNDLDKLRVRLSEHKKFINSISNHRVFKVMYPKIVTLVDLKNDDQVLATYWNEIRNILFDLIYTNGLKSGYVNLDTEIHRYQVKDGIFVKPWKLYSYDLIDCKLKNSVINECLLIGCRIKDSQLFYCELSVDNVIEESKIKSCHMKTVDNKFVDCYMDNAPHNIKGTLEKCIVRSGDLSEFSSRDEKTKIVDV